MENNYKGFKLNTPNVLVIIRFFLALAVIVILSLVPYSLGNWDKMNFEINNIKVSWLNVIAMIIFVVASITDWLDGYLARKNNQVTDFGKFFDPLADKILVNSVLVFFAAYLYVPIWVVVLFIVRDLMVDGLRMNLSSKGKVLSADRYGKLKTIFQMLGITILFIFHPLPNNNDFYYNSIEHLYLIPIYIALFFSMFSGFKYFKNNIKELM